MGLVSVYNLLPLDVVLRSPMMDISEAKLQGLTRSGAKQGVADWPNLLSTRWDRLHHPLFNMRRLGETLVFAILFCA